jgi:hypothetical protein
MATHYFYPTTNPDEAACRVGLQWSRGTDVRIVTSRQVAGADVGDEYIDGPDGPIPAWDGTYVPLGRDQLNHLIRQLRTARDQAYGRDE